MGIQVQIKYYRPEYVEPEAFGVWEHLGTLYIYTMSYFVNRAQVKNLFM